MKIWKRNAIIGAVLLLICVGIYVNWSRSQTEDLTAALNEEQLMDEATLVMNEDGQAVETAAQTADNAEYFAQVRLSRQQSRDDAVELLEQTIAADGDSAVSDSASQTLNSLVSTALSEAQIESLVIAKGYSDCVTYIGDDTVSVAVSAPAEGLTDADVALISDVVTAQTDFDLSQVRIVEVKS